MKLIPILSVVFALTVAPAFSQDSIEAPEASDDAVTNGAVEAPEAPPESIDADSSDPIEALPAPGEEIAD
jgi:hypothetical protein